MADLDRAIAARRRGYNGLQPNFRRSKHWERRRAQRIRPIGLLPTRRSFRSAAEVARSLMANIQWTRRRQKRPTSAISTPSLFPRWIKPESPNGGIVSRLEDYFGRHGTRALFDRRQAASARDSSLDRSRHPRRNNGASYAPPVAECRWSLMTANARLPASISIWMASSKAKDFVRSTMSPSTEEYAHPRSVRRRISFKGQIRDARFTSAR